MAEYLSKDDISTGEYISRDEALRALHQYCTDCAISCDGVMCRACDHANAMDIISDMPAADVVPALYGKWIERHDYIECSFCGFTVLDTYCEKRDCTNGNTYFNFCPRCGAYMGEPETTKG